MFYFEVMGFAIFEVKYSRVHHHPSHSQKADQIEVQFFKSIHFIYRLEPIQSKSYKTRYQISSDLILYDFFHKIERSWLT